MDVLWKLGKMTIPRLELLACVLGARLSKYVVEALSLSDIPKFCWSDSTTALSWIKGNDQWGTFVGNRVKEICSLTEANQWSYVPSQMNPADLPSRGCGPRHMLKLSWWEGPNWLKDPKDVWPTFPIKLDQTLVFSERRKGLTILNVNIVTNSFRWYEKISKFSKMVRTLAWVRRFIRNIKRENVNKENLLSAVEVQESKNALALLIQKESFSNSGDSINDLAIIRDDDGLIRVKTKIIERDDNFAFRYPLLLPSKHHIVECLILEYHTSKSHAGIQALMSMIREEFWILAARRTIRSVLKRCVKCKRFTAKAPSTVPIHLPADRVRDALIFEVTGVDLCGPLILRDNTKVWVVLFTCAVYRAVHLELVSSISSESFVQALRRFISRRGRPVTIYCDNGTNFSGTSVALSKVNWEELDQDVLSPIEWKFNPPTAAWWGGWWERLIRSTKNLLVRVLGRASVTYEELLTILCDVEAVINSRPLTYMSNNSGDLMPLRPSDFLQDLKETGIPDLDYIDRKKLLTRQTYCQEIREQFRKRFRKEYLSQLVQKAGQGDNPLKIGDVVLVGIDKQKRLNWPLAIVQELHPGRDGHIRVVKVMTQNGTLVRPVQKLFPLKVSACRDPVLTSQRKFHAKHRTLPLARKSREEQSSPPVSSASRSISSDVDKVETDEQSPDVPRMTRKGRVIKKPIRFDS